MAQVLVVDDDPDLLTLVEMQLKHCGHEVWTAGSGPAAIAMIGLRGAPDVAVLDVAMPGMNGIDVLEALRAIDQLADLPAIFLSARIGPEDIELGTSLGAMYVTKPYAMKVLMTAIDVVQELAVNA
jgi:CheY-like chemotaxis protein